ncbi:MAG TPA: hopanoid-associated sugar epimerase [Thermoanaerobaculia bacterium]|nr:hopanoid-associated sugar epimerase [Thermoanaerobaculia bacterium]
MTASATTLVTGGTGFVGAHLVRALIERGDHVRCLVRQGSDRANLEGLDVELVTGDLRDRASLVRAVAGCRAVYHCAADYRLFARRPADLYECNVEGSRNLLRAAGDAGAERIVYTSSVAALGLRPDGPSDETVVATLETTIGHYKKSKLLAQQAALELASEGLPVVIVNPSTPVGELDVKPTPTGRIIVDYLAGRMPAYVDTGLNLIDVRDVAAGHLLAETRGRIGEIYILGHRDMTLEQILDLLSELTGLPAVRWRLPHAVPLAVGALSTAWARLAGGEPRVSLESARMATKRMFFDAGKAVRELGLPQSPIEGALARAVEYFRGRGLGARVRGAGA